MSQSPTAFKREYLCSQGSNYCGKTVRYRQVKSDQNSHSLRWRPLTLQISRELLVVFDSPHQQNFMVSLLWVDKLYYPIVSYEFDIIMSVFLVSERFKIRTFNRQYLEVTEESKVRVRPRRSRPGQSWKAEPVGKPLIKKITTQDGRVLTVTGLTKNFMDIVTPQ